MLQMTGEDITVTFKTSDAAEILAGAGVVFESPFRNWQKQRAA